MNPNDAIAVQCFDREYDLADLLPLASVDRLFKGFAGVMPIAIVSPTTDLFYGQLHLPKNRLQEVFHRLLEGGHDYVTIHTDQGDSTVFPLVHELEPIGFLIIGNPVGVADSVSIQWGTFTAMALSQLIFLSYQNKMASGLHGQVVVASYRELEDKMAQLAKSEENYRCLAENLEVEVEKKTHQIQQAQLMLLQNEKLASIGQLAAGMAHEINNPIGFVISNLNSLKHSAQDLVRLLDRYESLVALVEKRLAEDPEHAAFQREIQSIRRMSQELDIDFIVSDVEQLIDESLEGSQRIKTIVQNLREFTHPSVDVRESANVKECLENTLAILAGQIPHTVAIRKEYQNIPNVSCYLRGLNQVFFHILRNALQAVEGRGQIAIRTRAVDQGIEIRIADSGPGIPEADLPHIFEPFFTTRPVGQGTGLGLNLAYNIVQKHGGTIRVDNRVGHGVDFIVTLPLELPQQPVNDPKSKINTGG